MAKFNYRFEKILKNKKHIETEIRIELKKLINKLNLEKIKLKIAEKKELKVNEEFIKKSNNKQQDINEIKLFYQYLSYLREYMERKKLIINELQEKIEIKRKELIDIQKERKILEKLKEKDKEKYVKEIEEKEQKFNDEIAILKYRTTSVWFNWQ